jgi:exonuclease SbcC
VRPRRLKVKGYTAFLDEADIDFDGLDLFAITGPTGAGKTSLLQAMTIALFGRAPKLGDDLRQLISPFADRAQFFLEFRAHGRNYRITRVMFKTRATTVAFEAQGDDGEWQTLTRGVKGANVRVEQILGLDFDSFTKVVLLPQNEFDAFLRGKPDERRSILTRLLSLEIYGRIQQRANQVASEARTQAEVLTGLLDRDYADATPERLGTVKRARAEAEAAVEEVTTSLEALERAAVAALDVRQRRLAHASASRDLAAHERALGKARGEQGTAVGAFAAVDREVETIAERLAAIAYDADRHLLLSRAEEQAGRLEAVIDSLARLDGEQRAGQAHIAELARRRSEAARVVIAAERALASAGDAERRTRVDREAQERRFGTRAAIAGLIERERRSREDRRQEKDVQEELETLTARESELTVRREELGPQHDVARAHLDRSRKAREECGLAFEAGRALQGQAAGLAERLIQGRQGATRAQIAVEQAQADVQRRRASLAEIAESRGAAQEVVRVAEETVRQLEREHAAHALRVTLAVGQPCPVCEANVSRVPAIEPLHDVEHANRSLVEARKRLRQAQSDEQQAAADLATAKATVRASILAADEKRSEVDRLAGELGQILPPELRDDPRWQATLQSRVDAAAADRAAAERNVDAAQRGLAEIDSAIAGIAAELRTLPARIDGQRQTLMTIRRRCEEAEQLLAVLLGHHPGPEAAAELAAIDVGLRQAEEALASASAEAQLARDRLGEARVAAAGLERDFEAEEARVRALGHERGRLTSEREEINEALRGIVPDQEDVAEAIANELAALANARARREEVGQELEVRRRERERSERRVAEAAARIAELERQLAGYQERDRAAREAMEKALADLTAGLAGTGLALTGAGDEHDQLSEAVQRAREDRDVAMRRSAALEAEEQGLAEKIGRAAECRQQRDAARTRAEVARELGQLLGATNLQTYVLADAMRVLVEDGSLHLQRLSDGRYRLQAEDLDFHVVDAWNGDAVRSVKTLSGGETFLTSLALALALAERLADLAAGAHGHEALESLFVDEGFGALDAEETLETVVQAIEALQSHDRLVGVVTHLTPLAERMPAQIKVRKAPEGSHVEMVR